MYNEKIKKYDIGMRLVKEGKYRDAEKIFLEMLAENIGEKIANNTINKYVLFQMGKIRLKFGDEISAEYYFMACIKYFPNNVYPKLELGKLYGKQRKDKKAEEQFKKYIEIDRDRSPHARLELGRLYSILGMDEKASKMYSYIIENLDYDIADQSSRISHIKKHMQDDKTKDIHGVFTMDCIKILDMAIKNKVDKQIGYMCDIYCINVPRCGYEGGRKGDGHILNYVTFITLPNSNNIITIFPSDEIIIHQREKGFGIDD